MKKVKGFLAVLLALSMLLAMPVYATGDLVDTEADETVTEAPVEGEEEVVDDEAEEGDIVDGEEEGDVVEEEVTSTTPELSYLEYYKLYSEEDKPSQTVALDMSNVLAAQNAEVATTEQDGVACVQISKENTWVEWQVEIPATGIYNFTPNYYQLEDSRRAISLNIIIDGAAPFIEAQTLSLPRIWEDAAEPEIDELGNEIRPSQKEAPQWTTYSFLNELGMYTDPYFFYLEEGVHTIRIERVREAVAIESVTIGNQQELPSYEEYAAQYPELSNSGDKALSQQAEVTLNKTDSTLYALVDHQDAGTTPNHPTAQRLNTIGGSNWSGAGQAITWKVSDDVQPGWYKFAMRARQNSSQGMQSYRTLKINGEIPFAEAVDIAFPYDTDWGMFVLGGEENPQYLYLEPGDEITLTVSPGKLSDVLRSVQESVLKLNEIYRKIIVITGTSPDVYQDYYLEDEIPGLRDMFLEQRDLLTEIANKIVEVNGKTGAQTSTLMEAADKLEVYAGKSYEITADLAAFKSSIESLSSLLLTFGQQPLEIDIFYYVPKDVETPKAGAGFWNSVVYSVQKFIGSFFTEYQLKSEEGAVEAWVTTGRDQMQIVSSLVNEFSDKYNIPVTLSLVDTGDTLLSATMAGKGPDVALMIGYDQVINLAMRGAIVDLDAEYGVYAEMGDHFTEAAWKRFRFNNGETAGIYAIPETQSWPMVFYRTDIFDELNLEAPATWTEFYEMLRTLQGQNMNVGMPETSSATPGVSGSIDIFQSLVHQRGSTYYNDSLTATRFDETEVMDAFEQWSEFYSKYGVPRSVDFYNRFRTGDIPIGITGYTTYNQLMAAAPELRGLWKMAVIPGTEKEDGTIDHTAASGGTGCMMMTTAKKRGVADNAAKFLMWWTDTEQQDKYGKELEATMGVAARYNPADKTVLAGMGWTEEELNVLTEQMNASENVYAVPGDYLLARSLTNALRTTLDNKLEPRRTLSQYNRDINAEITRKRKEFGLDK